MKQQDGSIDRAWPLDIIPRTISRREWLRIEAGLRQRVVALNRFHRRHLPPPAVHRRRVVPRSIIASFEELSPAVPG
ncbi:MAG: circularly permuted type 2 ATP-grasp protein, partial [Microcoleus sp. SM1_3_4]|nr:circularly permuted type 2 ATP-grasp protein [Microcoleus sp. SM1_3_4]